MDLVSMVLDFIVFGATTLTNVFKGEVSNLRISGLDVTKVVMGGHNASIEDHPYQVHFSFIRDDQLHGCGGSIISKRHILTAAHCVVRSDVSSITLRAGHRYRTKGIVIPIAEAIPHPGYETRDFDVAVLKTTKPIKFSKKIQPVKLPHKGKPIRDNAALVVAGWGITGGTKSSIYLQAVVIPVVNFEECQQIHRISLTENMFCAGFHETIEKSACAGDSGGGAVHDGEVVGIVSFGRGCEVHKAYPTIFANVAAPAIRDFIKQHTGY